MSNPWAWGMAAGAAAAVFLVHSRPESIPPIRNLGELEALLERIGFPVRMLLSVALWLGLSVYWEAAAKNAAATTYSESRASRWFHLILVSLADLLIMFPVPG